MPMRSRTGNMESLEVRRCRTASRPGDTEDWRYGDVALQDQEVKSIEKATIVGIHLECYY